MGYQDRIKSLEHVAPRTLKPHPKNPNRGNIREVMNSIKANGFVEPITVQQSTRMILGGHTRWSALMNLGAEQVPVIFVDVDDDEALRLLIALNRSTELRSMDNDRLAQVLEDVLTQQGDLEGTLYDDFSFQQLLDELDADLSASLDDFEQGDEGKDDLDEDEQDDDAPERLHTTLKSFADVPDTIFPSDNDLGIPVLLTHLQADVPDMPATLWGEFSRSNSAGTIFFYVDDYKFQAVWKDPSKVSVTGAPTIAEVNFSTHDAMPAVVVLWRTYQKRYLARMWQSFGHRILVDVNVEPKFWDMNLLGVPKGWRSYCTRGAAQHVDDIVRQVEQCKAHAESDDILFVVYGGNAAVRDVCLKHNLWWQPEKMDLAQQRFSVSDMLTF